MLNIKTINLAKHQQYWLKPPNNWHPEEQNHQKTLQSLIRHLFVQYTVPKFMDSVWFHDLDYFSIQQQKWYRQLGLGSCFCKLNIPIKMTRKMA